MWRVKQAVRKGGMAEVTLSRITGQDEEGNDVEETRVVRHYRSSFPITNTAGSVTGHREQTLAEWRANLKREIQVMLANMNASEEPEQDITPELG